MAMPSMGAKVIVSTYQELPRRRRRATGHGGGMSTRTLSTSSSAPATRAGGYDRRALLLAYAHQLRWRRRGGHHRQSGRPPALQWREWKEANENPPGAGADDVAVPNGGGDPEAAEKLVRQVPVLRPALGHGVSPASQEGQGERVVQERR
ncbi:hypothetical protein ACP70R_025257 [Stipagrostis hirtigluma subsp. patula]